MWINIPEPLQRIAQGKEAGTNNFILQIYSYDRFPSIQEGLFYLKKWSSLEEVLIKWLCIEHDVVVVFSAKDNLKFPDMEMERKFKDMMFHGTEISFISDDKYSRMSMEGIKLFELPKDVVESAYAISAALEQQKLKIAVVILRAEVLLPRTGIDYRLLDNIKCWESISEKHTVVFLTDNKENIHHEIRHIGPPLMVHLEWSAPIKEDFEKLFMSLKIVSPKIFDGNDIKRLAVACEGLHYLEIEILLKQLEREKKIFTEDIPRRFVRDKQKLSAQSRPQGLFLGERPNTTFDMVVGLESVKEIIRTKFIYPLKYPDLLKKRKIEIRGGLLLFGPPGTGKTMIGKAIATELNAPFFLVSAADIKNAYVGESENNVKRLFAEARKQKPYSIIFIDEIESLFPRRGTQESTHMNGLIAQFLAEMEGINTDKQTPVLVIGATNRPLDIDSAALRPGRFDYKILVPLPDKEMRQQLFHLHLRDSLTADIDYLLLADWTDGCSGADIAGICRRSEEALISKDVQMGINHPIDMNIIGEVIRKSAPSVTKMDMERFRELGHRWNEC